MRINGKKVERRITDKDRLDWLEAHARGIDNYYDEDEQETIWWVQDNWAFRKLSTSLRGAIDEAMKKIKSELIPTLRDEDEDWI